MPKGNYTYHGKYYENSILFTGIKDGFEYIDGIKKGACFAEYTGESFYCNIPDVKDYNTKYTIIKFTPDYSQDYCFNRSGGDTVIKIQRNGNNIQTGSYDVDDEEYNTYLYGGETYYIGVAMQSGSGTISLDVGPYYGGDSSSSSNYYESSSY